MLKEHSKAAKFFVAFTDCMLLCAAFFMAFYWRSTQGSIGPVDYYLILLYISVPVTLSIQYFLKLYGQLQYMSLLEICTRTIFSLFLAGVVSSSILYLTHAGYFSRLLFGYYFVLGSVFITVEKIFIKIGQNYLRKKGYNTRNILLIGSGGKLDRLVKTVKEMPQWGLKVGSIIDITDSNVPERVKKALKSQIIDEVFIAFSRDAAGDINISTILGLAEEFGKTIKVFINLDEELHHSKIDFCHFADMPALVFYSKTIDPDMLILKRGIDIMGSLAGLCITAAIFPFVAIAIKLDSPGPVLFTQTRIGLNGREIKIFKFRSMYKDAEDRKRELLKNNEAAGPVFKMKNDPRITRVGRFLRKTSIDEFPQFWNVFKGDMSLVGTRPPTPDEVRQYRAWHYRRISIRPGLTGLWQVSGRNKIKNFDEIVTLDLKYISSWSIWLDCKILAKTVAILFRPDKSGAM